MNRIFLSDPFPGWYVRLIEEGRQYTFGPYSEAECAAVLGRLKAGDMEALWDEMETVASIVIIKQEVTP